MFGKQDPYAIGTVRLKQHPLNTDDSQVNCFVHSSCNENAYGAAFKLVCIIVIAARSQGVFYVMFAVTAAAHAIYRSFQHREVRWLSAGVDSQQ